MEKISSRLSVLPHPEFCWNTNACCRQADEALTEQSVCQSKHRCSTKGKAIYQL